MSGPSKKENKVYYKVDQLKIRLVLDDVVIEGNDKTQDNPRPFPFKPKMVDSSLNDIIYFTPKFKLTPENLLDAGFNNNTKTHREVLTDEDKMRKFISYMTDNSIQDVDGKSGRNKNEVPKNGISDDNKKFINTVFFKKNEILKTSDKKQFVIYESEVDKSVPTTRVKQSKKYSKGDIWDCIIKIKLLDKNSKLTTLDKAKLNCMERAKSIEKNADELFGLTLKLYKTTNMYNPLEVYKQISKQTSSNRSIEKKDKKDIFDRKIQKYFRTRDEEPRRIYKKYKDTEPDDEKEYEILENFLDYYEQLREAVLDEKNISPNNDGEKEEAFLDERIDEYERNGVTRYKDLLTNADESDVDNLKRNLRDFYKKLKKIENVTKAKAKVKSTTKKAVAAAAAAEKAENEAENEAEKAEKAVEDAEKAVEDAEKAEAKEEAKDAVEKAKAKAKVAEEKADKAKKKAEEAKKKAEEAKKKAVEDTSTGGKRKKRYTRRRGKSRKSKKKTKKFKNTYRKL